MEHIKLFIQYITFERRYSKHTQIAYQKDLGQFSEYIQSVYDISSVHNIKHIHIRAWIVSLIQENITPKSINRKLSCLKSFFKFVLKRGGLKANPMSKIISPKLGKRLPVFVDKRSINSLFEEISFSDDYEGQRDLMILELLYLTGIRRSELIGLRKEDIDLNKRLLKVLGKGKKERLIPMTDGLKHSLIKYISLLENEFEGTDDYLFLTKKGKKLYPKLVYLIVKRALSQVTSIEQKSPHVLRHSFATHLSNNGAELNAIKELLGHKSLSATQVYTHNSIDRLKAVYQKAHPKAKGS